MTREERQRAGQTDAAYTAAVKEEIARKFEAISRLSDDEYAAMAKAFDAAVDQMKEGAKAVLDESVAALELERRFPLMVHVAKAPDGKLTIMMLARPARGHS